jgi:hypothetical protein
MPRLDDASISGDVVLYRRIPPHGGRVTWDETGLPIPSSFNFKDKDDELSFYLANETTPELVLKGHKGFGLVYLTAERTGSICGSGVILCRDDEDPTNGHVLLCGRVSNGMAKKMSNEARWVQGRWPARLPHQDIGNSSNEPSPENSAV